MILTTYLLGNNAKIMSLVLVATATKGLKFIVMQNTLTFLHMPWMEFVFFQLMVRTQNLTSMLHLHQSHLYRHSDM